MSVIISSINVTRAESAENVIWKEVTVLSYECEICCSFLSLFDDTVPAAEVI
jgi:hypothetical protein